MSTVSTLDQFLDPTNGWFTPDAAKRILAWRPDPAVQSRIEELGEKANEGLLTPEEDAEYERYIEDGDFIAVLQLKARQVLKKSNG